MSRSPLARLAGRWARSLVEVTDDIGALESGGRWAVAVPYSGRPVLARFDDWSAADTVVSGPWVGPDVASWQSSMDENAYRARVGLIREAIEAGTVYQANLCRILSAAMPDGTADDVAGLHQLLERGNPSPYGGFLRLPGHGVAVVSASPELFLSVRTTESGRVVTSGPIKGTGATAADLTDKDSAENVMIVDLVRNDLSRVCVPGSVTVPALLEVQEHPGLVHLVSRVQGLLCGDVTWSGLFAATFPPGSVTGAPKSSALRVIDECESAPREFYCGAFGWVDADAGEAELAVAIRTFWLRDGVLRFGTGAGITWASDARREWEETELKARRLVEVASGSWSGDGR
ncbi:MAG TPA: chloride transporter [Actinobacteria bacterium]|nr:chloride transporter [Actinomycetota bacterium]